MKIAIILLLVMPMAMTFAGEEGEESYDLDTETFAGEEGEERFDLNTETFAGEEGEERFDLDTETFAGEEGEESYDLDTENDLMRGKWIKRSERKKRRVRQVIKEKIKYIGQDVFDAALRKTNECRTTDFLLDELVTPTDSCSPSMALTTEICNQFSAKGISEKLCIKGCKMLKNRSKKISCRALCVQCNYISNKWKHPNYSG